LKNSISYRASTIRIVIAAALAISMLVAGISLAILQRQHQGYAAASQAKQQDQRTIQNLHGNFAKRSTSQQHTD
jgi:hypothetical protein